MFISSGKGSRWTAWVWRCSGILLCGPLSGGGFSCSGRSPSGGGSPGVTWVQAKYRFSSNHDQLVLGIDHRLAISAMAK